MIIINNKKFIRLEDLNQGVVFQRGDEIYMKTTLPPTILDIDHEDAIVCINLGNGDWTYFFNDDLVYLCDDAELVL